MESKKAINEDFNISTNISTSVLELAQLVWKEIHGKSKPFNYELGKGFEYDVQKRVPDTTKAKEILGFKAEISLEESIKEVAYWIKNEISSGRM